MNFFHKRYFFIFIFLNIFSELSLLRVDVCMFDPRDKKYPSKEYDDEEWEFEDDYEEWDFEDEDYDYDDRD